MIPATPPFPAPARNSNGSLNETQVEGEFYDDELPPELFDQEEDVEDLQTFMRVAPAADEGPGMAT